MGLTWNVIHPLAIIAIYSFVFSRVFKIDAMPGDGRFPYTFYLCSGFFPWLAFSDCITRGCTAFITNAHYLKKLPIPEPVFVAQGALASTFNLCINFTVLLIVALALGWTPRWTWLLLPVPLVMLLSLGFAVGLLLGTLNVFFRDIAEWTTLGLQLVMWSVPIVYRLSTIPSWLDWHPLMPALVCIRSLFLGGRIPSTGVWVGLIAWPIIMTIFAWTVLRKLRPEIRDLI